MSSALLDFTAAGCHLPGITLRAPQVGFFGAGWSGSLAGVSVRSLGLPLSSVGLGFCADIEEKGVRMKLTVIDTPGFGDHINNENW